jgi:phage FluMu gp28-like protein
MVLPKKEQLHFQYIDEDVMKHNPRYRLHCETQKAEIGEFSPEYLMSYKLKWIFENDKPFTEESVKVHIMRYDRDIVRETARPVVIGIDLASKRMSSVVTVVEIQNVKNIHNDNDNTAKAVCTAAVCDWLEIKDTPYPQQRPAMKSFIDRYENIVAICVDTTGAGDPVFSQMKEEWTEYEGVLKPYIFNGKSKADLAKTFDHFFFSDRLIIPSTKEARKTKKWQHFFLQLINLVSVVKDGYSYYARNEKLNTSRDDYVDSLMLALYGVNEVLQTASMNVEGEETMNPYYNKTNPTKISDSRVKSFPGIEKIRDSVRNGTYKPPNQRSMNAKRRTPKLYRK